MRIKFMFWPFVFLFFAASCKETAVAPKLSRAEIADSAVTVFEQKLFQIKADSLLQQTSFNGIVSVSRNGKILYEKTQGFENFKLQKPLTSNSVFAIASISKQFTAALILQLEENNRLKISDKAAAYLPELKKNFPRITLEQLLTHTSGMNDFGSAPLSAPGEKYSYSNKGYFLLGKIAEKASGKPLHILYTEIFKTAGMTNASTAEGFSGQNLASAHLQTGKGFNEVENMPRRLAESTIGTAAGGILASASDLHKWNYALHSGKVLSADNLKKMRTGYSSSAHYVLGEMGYGYGIMQGDTPQSYFHSGYVKGSPSLLIFYPKSKTSVVILSNTADERLGKKSIFKLHQEIKQLCDWLERAKEKS